MVESFVKLRRKVVHSQQLRIGENTKAVYKNNFFFFKFLVTITLWSLRTFS